MRYIFQLMLFLTMTLNVPMPTQAAAPQSVDDGYALLSEATEIDLESFNVYPQEGLPQELIGADFYAKTTDQSNLDGKLILQADPENSDQMQLLEVLLCKSKPVKGGTQIKACVMSKQGTLALAWRNSDATSVSCDNWQENTSVCTPDLRTQGALFLQNVLQQMVPQVDATLSRYQQERNTPCSYNECPHGGVVIRPTTPDYLTPETTSFYLSTYDGKTVLNISAGFEFKATISDFEQTETLCDPAMTQLFNSGGMAEIGVATDPDFAQYFPNKHPYTVRMSTTGERLIIGKANKTNEKVFCGYLIEGGQDGRLLQSPQTPACSKDTAQAAEQFIDWVSQTLLTKDSREDICRQIRDAE